jgi:CDP-diacylglycerol---glycerol-3-phosphate 3-phosphatidyltransferase
MLLRRAALGRLKVLPVSTNVVSLPTPKAYYEFLREQIRKAQNSITLSALYLGSGPLENELVGELRAALKQRSELQLTVILDHSRAQRSSAPLAKLVDEFGKSRVKLLLYQMPQFRGLLSRVLPAQVCEILGVYHCKFNIFDSGVLLSGANLSEEYFVNRQDRYLFFPDDGQASLRVFLTRFVALVEPHCHQILPGNETRPPSTASTALGDLRYGLLELVSSSSSNQESSEGDAMALLPLVQHAPARIDHESSAIPALLLDALESRQLHTVALASPYPSLAPALAQALHRLRASASISVSVLTSSLASHGFARAKGFKALVPLMHRQALSDALGLDGRPAAGAGVSTTLYDRKNWTFHAKGLWLKFSNPSPKPNVAALASSPSASSMVTYIGSSNLGARSWERDFELGFLLTTSSPQAVQVLSNEYSQLAAHARADEPVGQRVQGVSSTMAAFVPVLTHLCRSFL